MIPKRYSFLLPKIFCYYHVNRGLWNLWKVFRQLSYGVPLPPPNHLITYWMRLSPATDICPWPPSSWMLVWPSLNFLYHSCKHRHSLTWLILQWICCTISFCLYKMNNPMKLALGKKQIMAVILMHSQLNFNWCVDRGSGRSNSRKGYITALCEQVNGSIGG